MGAFPLREGRHVEEEKPLPPLELQCRTHTHGRKRVTRDPGPSPKADFSDNQRGESGCLTPTLQLPCKHSKEQHLHTSLDVVLMSTAGNCNVMSI